MKKLQVGSEIDAYCGKCKLTLAHVIVAMVDHAPRRIRCLTCSSDHNYRPPKKTSTRTTKAASSSKAKTPPRTESRKWAAATASWDESRARVYHMHASYEEGDLLVHPKFGKGVVTDVPSPTKIIALFQEGEKTLMQARP